MFSRSDFGYKIHVCFHILGWKSQNYLKVKNKSILLNVKSQILFSTCAIFSFNYTLQNNTHRKNGLKNQKHYFKLYSKGSIYRDMSKEKSVFKVTFLIAIVLIDMSHDVGMIILIPIIYMY